MKNILLVQGHAFCLFVCLLLLLLLCVCVVVVVVVVVAFFFGGGGGGCKHVLSLQNRSSAWFVCFCFAVAVVCFVTKSKVHFIYSSQKQLRHFGVLHSQSM